MQHPLLLPALLGSTGFRRYYSCFIRAEDLLENVTPSNGNSLPDPALIDFFKQDDCFCHPIVLSFSGGEEHWYSMKVDNISGDAVINDIVTKWANATSGYVFLPKEGILEVLHGQTRLAAFRKAVESNEVFHIEDDLIPVIIFGFTKTEAGHRAKENLRELLQRFTVTA